MIENLNVNISVAKLLEKDKEDIYEKSQLTFYAFYTHIMRTVIVWKIN